MRSTLFRIIPLTLIGAFAGGTIAGAQPTVFARPATTQPVDPGLPSVALPAALERVLRDYEKAWTAGDAAALAALFTSDGFVLNSGKPPVRGTADVTELYRTTSGSPLSLRAFAFAMSDTVGYIVGGFARDRTSPDGGKFILLVRRAGNGPWMIAADMDNANRRPGG